MTVRGKNPTTSEWNWPGARWWKCDLHVHTPASYYDFEGRDDVKADEWVQAALKAGLHTVAITDHNTGAWIAEIQQAVRASGSSLVVFPGVELTVANGSHLLALFDPASDGDAIKAFLGACDIPSEKFGQQDALASCTELDAITKAAVHVALIFAAHADDAKGILTTHQPGKPLQKLLAARGLLAVELTGANQDLAQYVDGTTEGYRGQTLVSFSDAHSVDQIGRRFTWVKMTRPNLEGLRLALQDGPLSVIREADAAGDPNEHGSFAIESIHVANAKYMGRPESLEVRFNPWLNAIIGGRGTGKSTLVEFLRIALRRERELPESLRTAFRDFKQVSEGRDGRGVLLLETEICVIYRKDGARFRVRWDQAGSLPPIEEREDGGWHRSPGEVSSRFPVRLYSQKQIFELAGRPEALLRIIDEAPAVDHEGWAERWRQEESRFLALRARAREIAVSLGEAPRLEGELEDVKRRLKVFEQGEHAKVRRSYQERQRQRRAVTAFEEGVRSAGDRLRQAADEVLPEEFDRSILDEERDEDRKLRELAEELLDGLRKVRDEVLAQAKQADEVVATWRRKLADSTWKKAVEKAEGDHRKLVETLQGEGISDLDEYGGLVQRRQLLEDRLASLRAEKTTLSDVEQQGQDSLERLLELRSELTSRRQGFLREVLAANPHVRITVLPMGDRSAAEWRLRELLATDRFDKDIGDLLDTLYQGGEGMEKREEGLATLKKRLVGLYNAPDPGPGLQDARFATHVQRLTPEQLDRLEAWFPEDSLEVSYSPSADGRRFRPIEQGSPGQKTAALLAFLLSYGQEPIVLDQPEDDLDSHLIYGLIVAQLRAIKSKRQVIVVTHNPNIVVNGDAELVIALDVTGGQSRAVCTGGLQEQRVRDTICEVMEGGREAFERRYQRIAGGRTNV